MSVRNVWDERSSYREAPQRYTVKRYAIPRRNEEEERVSVYERDRPGFEETRIVRRERTPTPPRVERDIRIERYEREPEPRRYEREYRYERDVEREPPRHEPFELERYTRSTEYFPPAPRAPLVIPQPQPQPREEEDFQVIRRSEVIDDRQVARREPQREEDYYYERRTRRVEDDRSDDDYREERIRRGRTVSPNDSVSQHRHRDYSSDDSMVYVKKEVREERGSSPSRRRHLAEGAVAGIGAAELIRHHRKKSGEEESSRSSRIGKDLGAAALGAVGAEVISRAKSRRRSKSHGGSPDRDGRRRHRHSRRSRSRSRSRVKQLAGLGLGAAAIAAAVGYARHKNNQKNEPNDRRSRSRTRRNSTSGVPEEGSQNKSRMAQAGLAGAAIAGLVERARSKSRTRSQSRLRTGIPIAAAGLGSAAIAGLYGKQQERKKEEEARETAKQTAKQERRRSRSRSRSMSAMPYEGPRAAAASDPGLIEYGEAPVYSNGGVPDFYNRPASQAGYYQPPPAQIMAPAAAAAAGAYGGTRVTETRERVVGGRSRSRDRDRERRRELSPDSSDGERRRRHRRRKSGESERQRSRSQSRSREFATAGLAAGAAGLAANEYAKRKQRKKEEKERARYEAENASYQEPYSPQEFSPIAQAPPGVTAPGYPPEQFYPSTNQFPPPPNAAYSPQPNYNPAEFPPQGTQVHPDYGYSPQQPYTPPHGVYSPPPVDPYAAAPGRGKRGDENVSAEPYLNTAYNAPAPDPRIVEEGLTTPRGPSPLRTPPRASSQPAPSAKSVQFDDSVPATPEQIRNRRRRSSRNEDHGSYDSESSMDDRRHRRSKRSSGHRGRQDDSRTPSPAHSDETIDLPARFDPSGRKKPERGEDLISDKIEDFLSGKGSAGKLFKSLTDGILGGGNGDVEKDSQRRRR